MTSVGGLKQSIVLLELQNKALEERIRVLAPFEEAYKNVDKALEGVVVGRGHDKGQPCVDRINTLRARVDSLSKALKDNDSVIVDLQEELSRARAERDLAQAEREDLRKQLEEEKRATDDLSSQVASYVRSLEEQRLHHEDAVARAGKAAADTHRVITALLCGNEALRDRCEASERALAEAAKAMDEASKEIERLQSPEGLWYEAAMRLMHDAPNHVVCTFDQGVGPAMRRAELVFYQPGGKGPGDLLTEAKTVLRRTIPFLEDGVRDQEESAMAVRGDVEAVLQVRHYRDCARNHGGAECDMACWREGTEADDRRSPGV